MTRDSRPTSLRKAVLRAMLLAIFMASPAPALGEGKPDPEVAGGFLQELHFDREDDPRYDAKVFFATPVNQSEEGEAESEDDDGRPWDPVWDFDFDDFLDWDDDEPDYSLENSDAPIEDDYEEYDDPDHPLRVGPQTQPETLQDLTCKFVPTRRDRAFVEACQDAEARKYGDELAEKRLQERIRDMQLWPMPNAQGAKGSPIVTLLDLDGQGVSHEVFSAAAELLPRPPQPVIIDPSLAAAPDSEKLGEPDAKAVEPAPIVFADEPSPKAPASAPAPEQTGASAPLPASAPTPRQSEAGASAAEVEVAPEPDFPSAGHPLDKIGTDDASSKNPADQKPLPQSASAQQPSPSDDLTKPSAEPGANMVQDGPAQTPSPEARIVSEPQPVIVDPAKAALPAQPGGEAGKAKQDAQQDSQQDAKRQGRAPDILIVNVVETVPSNEAEAAKQETQGQPAIIDPKKALPDGVRIEEVQQPSPAEPQSKPEPLESRPQSPSDLSSADKPTAPGSSEGAPIEAASEPLPALRGPVEPGEAKRGEAGKAAAPGFENPAASSRAQTGDDSTEGAAQARPKRPNAAPIVAAPDPLGPIEAKPESTENNEAKASAESGENPAASSGLQAGKAEVVAAPALLEPLTQPQTQELAEPDAAAPRSEPGKAHAGQSAKANGKKKRAKGSSAKRHERAPASASEPNAAALGSPAESSPVSESDANAEIRAVSAPLKPLAQPQPQESAHPSAATAPSSGTGKARAGQSAKAQAKKKRAKESGGAPKLKRKLGQAADSDAPADGAASAPAVSAETQAGRAEVVAAPTPLGPIAAPDDPRAQKANAPKQEADSGAAPFGNAAPGADKMTGKDPIKGARDDQKSAGRANEGAHESAAEQPNIAEDKAADMTSIPLFQTTVGLDPEKRGGYVHFGDSKLDPPPAMANEEQAQADAVGRDGTEPVFASDAPKPR